MKEWNNCFFFGNSLTLVLCLMRTILSLNLLGWKTKHFEIFFFSTHLQDSTDADTIYGKNVWSLFHCYHGYAKENMHKKDYESTLNIQICLIIIFLPYFFLCVCFFFVGYKTSGDLYQNSCTGRQQFYKGNM